MRKVIILTLTLFCTFAFAQSSYEKGMQKALGLWSEGKNTEASAMFERIAAAEKDNWLPNYYIGMVNTTAAFASKDKIQIDALLNKAQSALDIELSKQPNNAELLVLQAMIHTAWISFDPMTNGMKLSPAVMELYGKAEAIAPENPRVSICKIQFEMGSAKFFGTDVKPLCAKAQKAIELFTNFKPESPFHPSWGVESAKGTVANCNQ